MSDVELNRIQRYGGTRLIVFAYGVRLLGIATGACACLLSVFGFMSLSGGTAVDDRLPSSEPLYMGVNLLWFFVLGLLSVFAEIRVGFIKDTILKPFGFLHTYVGRGNFYLFFGSIVVSAGSANTFALAEGVVIVVLGVVQLLMAFFMQKKPKGAKPYEQVPPPGASAGKMPAAAGMGGPSTSADFEGSAAATPSLGATGTGKQVSTDGAAVTENPFLHE